MWDEVSDPEMTSTESGKDALKFAQFLNDRMHVYARESLNRSATLFSLGGVAASILILCAANLYTRLPDVILFNREAQDGHPLLAKITACFFMILWTLSAVFFLSGLFRMAKGVYRLHQVDPDWDTGKVDPKTRRDMIQAARIIGAGVRQASDTTTRVLRTKDIMEIGRTLSAEGATEQSRAIRAASIKASCDRWYAGFCCCIRRLGFTLDARTEKRLRKPFTRLSGLILGFFSRRRDEDGGLGDSVRGETFWHYFRSTFCTGAETPSESAIIRQLCIDTHRIVWRTLVLDVVHARTALSRLFRSLLCACFANGGVLLAFISWHLRP